MRGRPSLVSDDLLNEMNEKVRENCCFTQSRNFSIIFQDSDRKTRLSQVLCLLGTKTAYQGPQKKKKERVEPDSLSRYHFDREEFLDRTVIGDET